MRTRAPYLVLRYGCAVLLVATVASSLFWRPLLGPRHIDKQANEGSTVTLAGPVVALHREGEDLLLSMGGGDSKSNVVVIVDGELAGEISDRVANSVEPFFFENYFLGPLRGDAGRAWFRITGTLSKRDSVAEIRPHDFDQVQKLSTWFSWPEAALAALAVVGIVVSFRVGRRRSSEDA